jgi:hypothetical protein
MAITFQKVVQTAAASGTSFNVSITPNSAGDLLILGIGVFQSSQILNVTDNNGNQWIPVVMNDQNTDASGAVYYVLSCNSGATTITVTMVQSSTDIGLIVTEYSGCASNHPIDGFAVGYSATGTSITTGTLTTTQANDVIFSMCFFASDNLASIGGGYTLRSSFGTNIFTASGDLAAPTAGAYSGAWTQSGSGGWACIVVGLSPTDVTNPPAVPVQLAYEETVSAGSPITATFTNKVTASNAIVVLCLGASTMTWTGVTDSESNTYSPCALANTSAGCAMFVAFGVAGGTAAAVYAAYTGTFGDSAVYVLEVRDITAYDTGSANAGTSATSSTGSFTLGHSNEIVVAATFNSGSVSNPGGNGTGYELVLVTIGGFGDLIEYAQDVTGAQNAQGNLSGSQSWHMVGGGFYKPAAGPVVSGSTETIQFASAEW